MKLRLAFIVLSCLSYFPKLTAADRNPLGQTTYLKLDRSNSRTSALVRGGYLAETVLGVDNSDPDNEAILVKKHCRLEAFLVGTREGEATTRVDPYIFTQAFLDNLRAGQIYSTDHVKIRHMGYRDAVNMDGHRYDHADVLSIYDITGDTSAAGFGLYCLENAFFQLARAEAMERGESINPLDLVTNLKMTVLLHADAPVFGEVKVDLTGVYNGSNVKIGGDYIVEP